MWVRDEAIARWKAVPPTMPGGQPSGSDPAIMTGLMLRAVFCLALRHTEGLIASVPQRLGLELPVPDHSTLARRARTMTPPSVNAMPKRRWWCRSGPTPCSATRSRPRPRKRDHHIHAIVETHTDEAQTTEVAIAAAVLNRMLDLGHPNSVRLTGSAVGRCDLRNSSPRCNTPTRS